MLPAITEHEDEVEMRMVERNIPKFKETYCSHCGAAFGPGNHGYSHCEDHRGVNKIREG